MHLEDVLTNCCLYGFNSDWNALIPPSFLSNFQWCIHGSIYYKKVCFNSHCFSSLGYMTKKLIQDRTNFLFPPFLKICNKERKKLTLFIKTCHPTHFFFPSILPLHLQNKPFHLILPIKRSRGKNLKQKHPAILPASLTCLLSFFYPQVQKKTLLES